MSELACSLRSMRGIGEKKAALLSRLGLHTLEDCLEYFPRSYEDRTRCLLLSEVSEESPALVRAMVSAEPTTSRKNGGHSITRLRIVDESGSLPVVFFQNPYVASKLHVGKTYCFFGRVQGTGRLRCLVNPVFEPEEKAGTVTGRLLPLYPLKAGLWQRDIETLVMQALAYAGEHPDFLPPYLLERHGLLDRAHALRTIHQPKNVSDVLAARRRFTYEELLLFSCALQSITIGRQRTGGLAFADLDVRPFWAALPFAPTDAQRRVVAEAIADIQAGIPLQRLIQGDVGSGKTLAAAALCYLAIRNGYQAALMAPTEILATQHAETLAPLAARLGFSIVLLTGSQSAKQKKQTLAAIANGTAQWVIGTHALIQQTVHFSNLGLLVTDEQHRFGVQQRAALAAKGSLPHTVIMSATPIPRTLAFCLYGDLDISVLDELPPGRTPVKTFAVGESMRPRIHRFIQKICEEGRQCFVVCPLVEESAASDLKSAEAHAAALQQALPSLSIAFLHGHMKSSQKTAIMARYTSGEIQVLVSTTVIEVGVDVPNATLMIVENAERFGLSQLHQLRGRVGRGSHESFCILFGADKGAKAQERLQVLCHTNDGFRVAEEDLRLRGPGDFFGNRQHGLPLFRLASLQTDLFLLTQAQADAKELLAQPDWSSLFPLLHSRVFQLLQAMEFPTPPSLTDRKE